MRWNKDPDKAADNRPRTAAEILESNKLYTTTLRLIEKLKAHPKAGNSYYAEMIEELHRNDDLCISFTEVARPFDATMIVNSALWKLAKDDP